MLSRVGVLQGTNPVRNRGFSLIEALIALVVFSIGLLGMAAMYSKSMVVTHGAYMNSLASIQAMDMAERIRANIYLESDPGEAYVLTKESSRSGLQYSGPDCQPDPANPDEPAPPVTACSATELRDWDIANWLEETASLFGAMFDGVTISYDDSEDAKTYLIELSWRERGAAIDPDDPDANIVKFTYTVSSLFNAPSS